MWMRHDLKNSAKEVLKKGYWSCFLVSLILFFVSGGSGGNGGGGSHQNNGATSFDNWADFFLGEYFFWIAGLVLVIILLALAFKIFLGYTIELGCRKFYVKTLEHEFQLSHLGFGFNRDHYFPVILSFLLRDLFLFLWFLLLIIPGIIKLYAYSMVPYILADNPQIGAKRAIELSNEMTQGEKFNIFVLQLSFLGWFILGVLALFVGVFFVFPYYDATMVQLYKVLRGKALAHNLTSAEELNLPSEEEKIDDNYYDEI